MAANEDLLIIASPGQSGPPPARLDRPERPLPRVIPKDRDGWCYTSADGIWGLERVETSDTAWILTHLPTCKDVDMAGSLEGLRRRILEIEERSGACAGCSGEHYAVQHTPPNHPKSHPLQGCQVPGCGCIEFRPVAQ